MKKFLRLLVEWRTGRADRRDVLFALAMLAFYGASVFWGMSPDGLSRLVNTGLCIAIGGILIQFWNEERRGEELLPPLPDGE